MKRLKRIVTILLVNTLLLGLGLLAMELVFGVWLHTNNLNRLHLIKDTTIRFNVSRLYHDPNPIIQYSRDPYGLRGTHDTPGSIDLLTMGGSTTDQRYIRDGETWQDVMQRCFEETGVALVVSNAGVDGQSTYGHIKNFEWWFPHIPDFSPEYMLFYVGINDFYIEAGRGFDQLVAEKGDLVKKIKDNSAVYHVIRTLYGTYQAIFVTKLGHRTVDFNKIAWTHDAIQADYDFMDLRLDEYATRLRLLADLTHKLGAKPIFVSQPSRTYRITPDGLVGDSTVGSYDGHPFNGVDYYHMMRKLNGITKAVASEKDALFVDLASHPGWIDADFYDFAHMTPQGTEKVGERLCNTLKTLLPTKVLQETETPPSP